MDLEKRVVELERRVAAMEDAQRGEPRGGAAGEDAFWALEGLKEQLARHGESDGGVLFTGAVRVPTGEEYEWQYGLPTGELLDQDWSEAADVFAALGHAVRMRLLREIVGGRRTVAELTELDGLGDAGEIHHHLRQLAATGWLHAAEPEHYEVPPERVVPLLVVLAAARP
ncbi:helix-turn-helix transcriptional regulator [Streptomyces sp. XD-27]|uniref:ArsR/SmtB family transcription factor n=1 Tax=Streptomyces sp. XD-27 TaxID=3062779 RepID=UPI0026F4584F|nr:helix-turn-helix domain-containing protein [Streptomyces sp. XD-27]WKX72267.1 helix-turn-helix domain-containing protein [Streptomyces sp. XD-27]